MLDENVSPPANQPDSRAAGQPPCNPCNPYEQASSQPGRHGKNGERNSGKSMFQFLMLDENVSPAANQPHSRTVGQPLVTPYNSSRHNPTQRTTRANR
eukprot:742019-Pelagomonas_calceolata.AAC.1